MNKYKIKGLTVAHNLKKYGRFSYLYYNDAHLKLNYIFKEAKESIFDLCFSIVFCIVVFPFLLINYICSFIKQNFQHKENIKLCDQVIEMFKDLD